MRHHQYILRGKEPVACDDMHEWGRFFQNAEARRVAYDEVAPEITVSTVFLGLDHQYGQGPPLLFETMVFGGPLDQEQDRYSTWDEAERGHKEMIERVQAALIGSPRRKGEGR